MYSCNYCSKTYAWSDSLRRHIKMKHSNKAASENLDSTVKAPGSVSAKPSATESQPIEQHKTVLPMRESKLIKISNRKFVSIRKHDGEPRVNIRQYIHDSHGKPYSTKRGILLTATEWQQLKENTKDIDTSLYKCKK